MISKVLIFLHILALWFEILHNRQVMSHVTHVCPKWIDEVWSSLMLPIRGLRIKRCSRGVSQKLRHWLKMSPNDTLSLQKKVENLWKLICCLWLLTNAESPRANHGSKRMWSSELAIEIWPSRDFEHLKMLVVSPVVWFVLIALPTKEGTPWKQLEGTMGLGLDFNAAQG